MVREAAVLLFTAQDAPAKVMVTTPPVALAVAVQPVNPVPKVTVGVAGTVTFEVNVAVMVLPAASVPLGRGGEAHAPGGSGVGRLGRAREGDGGGRGGRRDHHARSGAGRGDVL